MKKTFKILLIVLILLGIGFSFINFTASTLEAFGGGTIHWKGTKHTDTTYYFGCYGPVSNCEITYQI